MALKIKSTTCTFVKMLVLLQVLCLHTIYIQAARQCTTSSGEQGTCVTLDECPDIRNFVYSRPLLGFGKIVSSVCSLGFFQVSVCCPVQKPVEEPESEHPEAKNEQPQFLEVGNAYAAAQAAPVNVPFYPPLCGYSNETHNRVVGGYPAALGAWPWMSAIGFQYDLGDGTMDRDFTCGGALISKRHVVTAAHCLNFEGVEYFVRLGAHELENATDGSHPVDYFVEKITAHPLYNNTTKENDIGVLRLNRDVQFTENIHPICLPLNPDLRNADYVGKYPFVAGWGATAYNGSESNVLMEVQVPVVENENCKKAYATKKNTVIDKRVLCAGYAAGGKDACQGDSGGPLMYPQKTTYYLIGVVSVGYRCATAGFPGIYTRITNFLDFILSNMK